MKLNMNVKKHLRRPSIDSIYKYDREFHKKLREVSPPQRTWGDGFAGTQVEAALIGKDDRTLVVVRPLLSGEAHQRIEVTRNLSGFGSIAIGLDRIRQPQPEPAVETGLATPVDQMGTIRLFLAARAMQQAFERTEPIHR